MPSQLPQNIKNRQANLLRQVRDQNLVEIRKSKQIEELQKRRGISSSRELEFEFEKEDVDITQLEYHTLRLDSTDINEIADSAKHLRIALSRFSNPPIATVLTFGILEKCVKLMHPFTGDMGIAPAERELIKSIQFEIAWIITNIASGTSYQTLAVARSGIIPDLLYHFINGDDEMKGQVIWAFGNIAGDDSTCRNILFNSGVLNAVLDFIKILINGQRDIDISIFRNCVWTLSNLCRKDASDEDQQQTRLEFCAKVYPILKMLLFCSDDTILTDTLSAIGHLTDGEIEEIEIAIQLDIPPILVDVLGSKGSDSITKAAMRAIGNIVTGDDNQTQAIVNAGFLNVSHKILECKHRSIIRECCWTISNIAAGTELQVQAVIDSCLVPRLLDLLKTSEFKIQKEICWAISNLTSKRLDCPSQTHYVVRQGCIGALCKMLDCGDTRIIQVILDAIENILIVGEAFTDQQGANQYAVVIEEEGGLSRIENLQNHQKEEIYEKCKLIIDKYYSEEVDLACDPPEFSMLTDNISVPAEGFAF
ncbi:Importin subunit alpha-2-like protein 2 [Rozella allomycis CSF55]|uniref:Importin subunit alpha n=1 Tax=Rozella allomycis (strain CSF55) TaxID=988480 RepID=A0A075AYG5_ROZAC|nr:Importin subunit alpha-2-like protein 2 [Rozella allomycis CSF55]|eukprot:EPZ35370.1 Importin subunit alpha-2-like protein 2 [Rozella allomycis CSF55]